MGERDRNLPANLKLRAPGPTYNQEEMRQAFRLIEQHYHIQLIPASSVGPGDDDDDTPPDDEFPTLGLGALYDADLGVTTTTRASSDADSYTALQADAPYEAATVILDQSGNANTLLPVGSFGPMIAVSAAVNGHMTAKVPGGGVGYPMNSTISNGYVVTEATIFCVARPIFANQTQRSEFQLEGVFGIGSETGDATIGGTNYGTVQDDFQFLGGWSGQTTTDTPFDIIVMTWDGTQILAYKNGYAMGFTVAMGGPPLLAAPQTIEGTRSFDGQVEWTTWGWWSRKLVGSEIKGIFSTQGAKYGIAVPL